MNFFRQVPGQPIYTHRYRCNCGLDANRPADWQDGWITEDTISPNHRSQIQHFQLGDDNTQSLTGAKACQGYLRHVKTEMRMGTVSQRIGREELDWGTLYLAQIAQKATANCIAVMWCDQSNQWFTGGCAHGVDLYKTNVPVAIRNKILSQEVDNSADCFGRNCAEVECVVKAYQARRIKDNLQGCKFIARKPAAGGISACKTCRAWISDLHGKWAEYKQGKFVGMR